MGSTCGTSPETTSNAAGRSVRPKIVPVSVGNRQLLLSNPCLPCMNTTEKLILIVDSVDENLSSSVTMNDQRGATLEMLIDTLCSFVQMKHQIAQKHQYAVVVLNANSATWTLDFTSSPQKVFKCLRNITKCQAEDTFNLQTLFDTICQHVVVPEFVQPPSQLIPAPEYTVRGLLFYGRSITIPNLPSDGPENDCFLLNPYFTLDMLIIHEPIDSSNNCARILHILRSIDQKGSAYFFSVQRDVYTLRTSMLKLLSHPLQRPPQQLANYHWDANTLS